MYNSNEPSVGLAIWELRKQRDLSLRDLSEQSGLSINAISKIERGENSPTVASLHALANALQVPITEFFRHEIQQHVVYVRASQPSILKSGGVTLESLGVGLAYQQLEPLKLTIEPGENAQPELVSHSGEEFVYCLKGRIEYVIDDQIYLLTPGDRLLFKASHPHCWRVIGTEPAELLLVLQADPNQPPPHKNALVE